MQHRGVRDSQILLLRSQGQAAREVARRTEISRHTVDLWRRRFLASGCHGILRDAPGGGGREQRRLRY
jgi:transposase